MSVSEMRNRVKDALNKMEAATDEEYEKKIWDAALDLIEMLVEATPTKIDDLIVKPLIRIIRRRFDIKD